MGFVKDSVDNIVTAINAGTYSQTFTAQKNYRPSHNLESKGLTVQVWPESYDRVMDARDRIQRSEARINIMVRRGVTIPDGVNSTADIDDMLDLVDEIMSQVLTEVNNLLEISSEGAYDGGRLYNDSDFAVIVTAIIRTMTR